MSLEGRVALVTGAGRGIGAAIAVALAEDGADVAINYRRDEESARRVVEQIEGLGRRAMAVAASVDDFDADVSMVNTVAEQLGPIDILVHNAGIASRGQAVEHTEPKEIQRVMATHAFAGHHLSQLVTPGMRAKGGGDIVVTQCCHQHCGETALLTTWQNPPLKLSPEHLQRNYGPTTFV